ncbi:MAG TPA: ABC transporter substrate-binding protein [Caldisericia bacterium]|nr:ABC transporter substrate-binding protein [Caldisericia bacterium]HRT36685.1 ABC transporter substrate-binding protein [Caldisericia bacterium]
MKKILSLLLILTLIFGFLGVRRTQAQNEFFLVLTIGLKSYVLNGMQFQMDVAPEIVAGRTFVPIRLVAETFGADVGWDGNLREVTIKQGTKVIKLKIGSKIATIDGKSYELEAAPYIKSGRTMVPIRFISEALGLSVYWEPQRQLVYIRSKPKYEVPGVSTNEIKIGTFSALTGPVAIIGAPFNHGLLSYINWINDQGGVYGRKIKVISYDDQFNPALTVTGVKKMVEEDKVFAIVGGLGTPGCLAVMDYLNGKGVPFVYQGSGVSALAIPPKKYVFAVQPNYTNEGQIFVKYIVDDLKLKKIALLYRDDDAGREGSVGVDQGISRFGGELVVKSPFPGTETDFTSYLLKVKQSDADALIVYEPTDSAIASNILKTAKSLGLTQKIFLPYSHAGIVAAAGEAAENVYITGWVDFSNPEDPGVQKFFEIWTKYYPKDNPLLYAYAVAGFVAGEIFVEALKRSGPYPTRDSIVWALETFYGWSGYVAKDISYGPNERSGKYSMFFMRVENGQLVKVSDWISVYQKP